MEASTDSEPVAARLRGTFRSKVSNGSRILPYGDGRSASARRFRDLVEVISNDLGGGEHLSEAQRQLVRRASLLSAESERLEAQWARSEKDFDVATYALLTNCLRRVCETVGLQRVARPVDGPLTLDEIQRHIDAQKPWEDAP